MNGECSTDAYEDAMNENAINNATGEGQKPIYVGETARVWRARIREHCKNAEKLRPDSFIVQHWSKFHSLSNVMPEFK